MQTLPPPRSASPVWSDPGSTPRSLHTADTPAGDQWRTDALQSLTLLDALQTTVPVGFCLVDREFRVVRVNPAMAAVSGRAVEDQLGHLVAEAVPELWPMLEPAFTHVLECGEAVTNLEISGPSASAPGETTHWLTDFYPARIDGEMVGIDVVALDISERKRAEHAELRYQSLFAHTSDAIFMTTMSGDFMSLNPAAEQLVGYTSKEAQALNALDLVVPEDRASAGARLASLADSQIESQADRFLNVVIRNKAGRRIRVEVSSSVVVQDGAPFGLQAIVRDVSERHALNEQLRHDAYHDALTGLPNRALFFDRLGHALAGAERERDSRIAVLLLDLDNFKLINDSLGHEAGDHLLVAVAPVLREAIRDGDTVARLGGDEFALVLENVRDEHETTVIAKRVIAAIANVQTREMAGLRATASLGIAMVRPSDTAETIVRNADTAMYRAKRKRKGSYVVFDDRMHVRNLRDLHLERGLESALEREELFVHYQPIVSFADNRLLALEALARWSHPVMGPVQPGEFIPVAESSGLIIPLGRWVLRQAAQEAALIRRNHSDALPLGVFANVSARELREPDYISVLTRMLEDVGALPTDIGIEVTEQAFIDPADPMIGSNLRGLSELGVRLSLDDFGTGYAALRTLVEFPFTQVKIDKFFIHDIKGETDPAPIATAVIALAHGLGLQVIAEGVETPMQAERLRDLGCDAAQGAYLLRPQPASAIAELISDGRRNTLLRAVS
jgi:diguanylate cyclase (GGDEF)-like protein/PAS domain S-box-containing protein